MHRARQTVFVAPERLAVDRTPLSPHLAQLGAAMKQLRERHSKSQEDLFPLDGRAGWDRSYYSKVERGLARPSVELVRYVAGYFGVDPGPWLRLRNGDERPAERGPTPVPVDLDSPTQRERWRSSLRAIQYADYIVRRAHSALLARERGSFSSVEASDDELVLATVWAVAKLFLLPAKAELPGAAVPSRLLVAQRPDRWPAIVDGHGPVVAIRDFPLLTDHEFSWLRRAARSEEFADLVDGLMTAPFGADLLRRWDWWLRSERWCPRFLRSTADYLTWNGDVTAAVEASALMVDELATT